MATVVILTRETLNAIAHSDPVAKALADKADRILPRAQRLALNAGAKEFAASLRVESGVRPGTKSPKGIRRPFARVIAGSEDAEDLEHGNANVDKQAILRRSMGA